jgi:hypothetical protein
MNQWIRLLIRYRIQSQFLLQLQILFLFDEGCDVYGDADGDFFRDHDALVDVRVEQVSGQGLI